MLEIGYIIILSKSWKGTTNKSQAVNKNMGI